MRPEKELSLHNEIDVINIGKFRTITTGVFLNANISTAKQNMKFNQFFSKYLDDWVLFKSWKLIVPKITAACAQGHTNLNSSVYEVCVKLICQSLCLINKNKINQKLKQLQQPMYRLQSHQQL